MISIDATEKHCNDRSMCIGGKQRYLADIIFFIGG